jgi:hypothetical protein
MAISIVSIAEMQVQMSSFSGVVLFFVPFFYIVWLVLFTYRPRILKQIQTMTGFGTGFIIISAMWLYFIHTYFGLDIATATIGTWGLVAGIVLTLLFIKYQWAPTLRKI